MEDQDVALDKGKSTMNGVYKGRQGLGRVMGITSAPPCLFSERLLS
ncbi:hypothetical protein SynMEDNS5_00352 [Synechococcus sp. MEDNS5]|nr:hypothetical protein SynMEDNS5_00352 [Synechococcus sp. MEDNS5]